MGVDIWIRLRKSDESFSKGELKTPPFSRGLGEIIQNAHYGNDPLLSKIENALNSDLSFLLKPDFFDYQVHNWDIDFEEDELKKQELIKAQNELDKKAEKSWVKIEEFIPKVKALIELIDKNANYYMSIDYDRKNWMNYLDKGEFEKELSQFENFLLEKNAEGYSFFTFDIV